MAKLYLRVMWEGAERDTTETQDRILKRIEQRFPDVVKTGWAGGTDYTAETDLQVDGIENLPHFSPNLSPEINANLAQTKRDGGVFTEEVPLGAAVLVQTRNTLYTLVNHGDRWIGWGGKHLPEMTVVHVNGSTFGGSMLKVGFIGIGMHLELARPGTGRTLTTTPIQSISVLPPEVAE